MKDHDDEITETSFSNVEIPKDQKETTYDFEMVLEYIGRMGKYQALLAIFLIYSTLPVGMHVIGPVFLLGVPEHRCKIPGVDDDIKYRNYSYQYLQNISTPATSEGYDGCKMYDYNYTSCLDGKLDCAMGSDPPIIPCQSYVYSRDEFGETIVTEWDLVCDRLILGTTSNTVHFAGAMFGCVVCGNISDNIGRRYVLLIGTILAVASGLACAFAPSLVVLTVTRFVIAIAEMALFQVGFVYVTELVSDKWRVIVGSVYNCAYAVGSTLLSAMAYFWTNWRRLQLAITLPFAPFLVMWILLPESPRWLFARGKNSEGKRISLLIARRNGSVVPRDIWKKTLESGNQGKKQRYYSSVNLFRGRGIREVTIIMSICFIAAATVYIGLSLNVGSLAGDLYLNNALNGIAEIVAGPSAIIILQRHGRRLPTSLSFILAGVMCTASSLANHFSSSVSWNMKIIGTSLALGGKFAISNAYNIIYLYVSEIYPTVVRASALSTVTTLSLVASTVTPYILHLQYLYSWLPGVSFGATCTYVFKWCDACTTYVSLQVIFGAVSVLAGVASLRLKDTRHQKMMTTLTEAEAFYRA